MRAGHFIIFSLSLITLPLLSDSVSAEEIKWQTNLKQAAQQARAEDKAMLIQIGASWCGFCHKMDRETYKDPKVIKHVNSCFVPIRVDADENSELVEAIGVAGLPTTVIITPELKIVKKISGYVAAPEMQGHLSKICLVNHEQAAPARKQQPIQKMSQKQVAPEFAFKSICLVSMLDDQELTEGKPEFTSNYRGQTVCFSSKEHKQKFDAEPENYWPAFEGKCRVSQLERNQSVEGDPYAGGVYRERLVFFTSASERDKFTANPGYYLIRK
ncbi:DUF255 domain-containing protein [Gimesia maris]|uniref:DUF255 domain-containing protein n=1 Tax=Gimesia maris TaxID=122 RepID=UPI000E7D3945|nr:DUF255 domain-containing protein [Gimesia maris]HAW27280.1 hypothetical protein [Planctomycetaceae bacterium]|tara:strand:- start:21616 stop:22428 length:813 start_codon:yes stop_codon:yes gene_type:complete